MALAETARLLAQLDYKDNLSPGVGKTLASVGRLESGMGRVGKGGAQLAGGLARVGLAAGAAAIGLGIAATKIGIDFQDAFAGVRKTVEGTPQELDGLYESLKRLSTRVPVGFEDLASIAQEAGALGVATADVDKFTEAVARTSAATVGLPVEAAAEAFGKLGTIFKLHGKDFEALGSSLVALGNAGASSEGDIIEVTKRFGAAGSVAKLSAAQVLGWSSAIASLGPEAESAGSALSRLFNNVTRQIGTNSDKLKTWAAVMGTSVADFKTRFARDASGTLEDFLQKLGRLDRFKQADILKKLGISNVRDIAAVQLLSTHTGELVRQVDLSTKAWKDNTELMAVSEKRFDTLKGHLTELKNTAFVAAAGFSEGLTPAIDKLAKKAQTFVLGHLEDIKAFGREVGDAIDGIDWAKVETGAKTFVDVLKTMLSIISKIPPEVDAAAVGFLGLNKLSGGLIGKGLGNIVGGLGSVVVKNVFERGSSPANPLWVSSVGGAAGGVPASSGGGLGIIQKVFLIGAAAGVIAELKGVLDTTVANVNAQAASNVQNAQAFAGKASDEDLANAIKSLDKATHDTLFYGTILDFGASENIRKLRQIVEDEQKRRGPAAQMTSAGGGVSSQTLGERAADARAATANSYYADIERGILAGNRDLDKINTKTGKLESVLRTLDTLHQDFLNQRAALRKAIDPVKIAKAAAGVTKDILKGVGNVGNTADIVTELKRQRRAAVKRGDRQLVKLLDADIEKVGARLAARQRISSQLRLASEIAAETRKQTTPLRQLRTDMSRLKDIQAGFVRRGDTHAAQIVGQAIKAMKERLAATTNNTTNVLRHKKLEVTNNISIPVKTVVNVRDSIHTQTTYKRYHNVLS